NAQVMDISGSGKIYTATISPKGSGEITIFIDENVAQDAILGGNGNEAVAETLKVMADVVGPTLDIYHPKSLVHTNFQVTFTFSEEVKGFTEDDIAINNGELVPNSLKTDDNIVFTAYVKPTVDNSVVKVVIAEGKVQDLTGTGNLPAKLEVSYEYSSIEDITLQNILNVYPNPASQRLMVELKDSDAQFNISIVDVSGKVVLEESNLLNNSELDVSVLPEGIYQMCITLNDAVITQQIAIRK
ncbi:MAG: Ig-like domain-containing protein, partial [Bacteroidales bacterium]|nr:Ig-like domain-containing protein [Bacteroidales bacterium]